MDNKNKRFNEFENKVLFQVPFVTKSIKDDLDSVYKNDGMDNGKDRKKSFVRVRTDGQSVAPSNMSYPDNDGEGSYYGGNQPNDTFNNLRNDSGVSFVLIICAVLALIILVFVVATGILRITNL